MAVLSVFQSQCWMIASSPKTYEVRKDFRSVKFLFLGGEGGPFGHRKLDEPGKTLA